jgi:large subunit ribosomal protein L15
MKPYKLPKTVKKRKKRVGRGYGSGRGGHTTGRGTKGQKARGKVKLGFEGGQLSLARRLPKRSGFLSMGEKPAVINLSDLAVFRKGETVDPGILMQKGLVEGIPSGGIKILGRGSAKALKIKGIELSASAREKILKAGGEILE